tara:strand:+ start:2817 stop:3230 length:414 start_codon:yes stop_codon:yes gene_type:complete
MKLCIVSSSFYPEITKMLVKGAGAKLKKHKIYNYKVIEVSGTYEIPVVISVYAHKFDAFIALGCVIKGKTPHFEFLCNSVFSTLQNLSIKLKKPISNAILTCNNKKQALERADPLKKNKGGDAAEAVISVLNSINGK